MNNFIRLSVLIAFLGAIAPTVEAVPVTLYEYRPFSVANVDAFNPGETRDVVDNDPTPPNFAETSIIRNDISLFASSGNATDFTSGSFTIYGEAQLRSAAAHGEATPYVVAWYKFIAPQEQLYLNYNVAYNEEDLLDSPYFNGSHLIWQWEIEEDAGHTFYLDEHTNFYDPQSKTLSVPFTVVAGTEYSLDISPHLYLTSHEVGRIWGQFSGSYSIDTEPLYDNTVPEPITLLLFGLGSFGLLGVQRKKF